MSFLSVQTDSNYVTWIELNRPEAKNAISQALLKEFHSHILDISKSNCRVLVIKGAGDSFSAGADLKERNSMSDPEVREFLTNINLCFTNLSHLPFPTIACINGFAFGGGLELALSCDIRYASESAIMGLTETKLGIIPGAGGTQRLSRIVGEQTAKEWIFSAKKVTAMKAKEKGLVSEIFSDGSLVESTQALANEIASSAPLAVRAAKKAIRFGIEMSYDDSIQWERLCYFETISTVDRREALSAFREKRKPNFKGE
jgi:enoyl-CoA hydratase/carnithine racemase